MVSRNIPSYAKATKKDKKTVSQRVVDNVFQKSGRFLEKHPSQDLYRELTLDACLAKTSQQFRDQNRTQQGEGHH